MRRSTLVLPLTLALLLAAGGEAGAQAKKSDAVVQVTAVAGKAGADGKQVVTVTLAMEGKWYVYANPVGLEDLEENKTVVTVTGRNKLASVKVDYPPATLVKDRVVGDYKVYKGKAVIRAHVQRAPGDAGPLNVSVRFMSCDGNKCLLPAEVRRSIP